jgi:peptidoglycan/xylan/chitin deacetylase (PgdA/CDA1 family)
MTRRRFLGSAAVLAAAAPLCARESPNAPALVAITLDLEMSRNYPTPSQTHWDYEKGNLDADTKRYSLEAARRVKARGGRVHFFCVGRVLEQENVDWLEELIGEGHPIGNHTYDHVNVKASRPQDIQLRFQRAPWLIEGKSPKQVIQENIRLCTRAMKLRLGIDPAGFRTPGGFSNGLVDRPEVQRMLLDQGYSWVSSLYPAHPSGGPGQPPTEEVFRAIIEAQAKAQPFRYPSGLVEVPMSPISDVTAFRAAKWTLPAFLEATRRAVTWAIENRAVFDFLAHPSCLVVEDPEFRTIELICELVEQAKGLAAIASLETLAGRVPGSSFDRRPVGPSGERGASAPGLHLDRLAAGEPAAPLASTAVAQRPPWSCCW